MQIHMFAPPPATSHRFIGRCHEPLCMAVVAVEEMHDSGASEVYRECPRGHLTVLRRVAGTYSDCPCDPRCTGARGHSCECSCGGKNHGSAWVPLGQARPHLFA